MKLKPLIQAAIVCSAIGFLVFRCGKKDEEALPAPELVAEEIITTTNLAPAEIIVTNKPVVEVPAVQPVLKTQKDIYTLEDKGGRSVRAQILYVDTDHVFIRKEDKTILKVGLTSLATSAREQIVDWDDRFGDLVTDEQILYLKRIGANRFEKIDLSGEPVQPVLVQPDPSITWKLVETFSDEFSGDTVDTYKWMNDLRPWGERAWTADNVFQRDGKLVIKATYEPHKGPDGTDYFYKLGILQSKKKTTYGYFEARIKGCSRFPGLCPAFWLYSNGPDLNPDYPHVTYSEIDIVEMLQNNFDPILGRKTDYNHLDCNLHTREIIDGVETWRRPQLWPEVCRNTYEAPWDPRKDFHLYACENTPEKITWYIDGIKVAESPNHNWHLPMSVTLTMELRPPLIAWAGEDGRAPVPEASTDKGFPTEMEVDYVRVWERE